MFCPKCGKELREYERSCPYCGAAAAHGRGNRHRIKPMELIAIAAGVLALIVACTVLVYQLTQRKKDAQMRTLTAGSRAAAAAAPAEPLARPQFLRFTAADVQTAAAVPDYSVSGDLHEITNLEWMEWNGLSDTAKAILAQNLFVVEPDFYSEFFGRYEWNRYLQIPNFVTVDSMMHTYHLYFSLLLNRTEKQQLAAQLQTLSKDMLRASAAQLDALTGTAWENAAKHSTLYFAVGAALQDPKIQVPEQVKDVAVQELSAIYAAEGIAPCAVTEDLLDYSQFKPRGYYEGDETLETYFRAMMWYGQINFTQKKEDMNRTALLITLALHDTASDSWEKLYAVTSFFAGVSDDLGYYEYLPAIEAAYGTIPDTELLRADETAYQHYTEQIRTLAAPQINSIPVVDPEGTVDLAEEGKGFRFMGQRFTLDAAVMQQLVFNKVRENAQGERRMLPVGYAGGPQLRDGAVHSDAAGRYGLRTLPGADADAPKSSKGSAGGAVVGEPLRGMAVHAQSSSGGKECRIPVVHDNGSVADKSAGNLRGQLYGTQARHGTLCQAGDGGDGRRPSGGAG